ncbi:TIGR02302 family protein [Limibacillus halophilus]
MAEEKKERRSIIGLAPGQNPGDPLLPLARLILIWEKLWPRLWPALATLLVFFCLAFFDVLPLLPGYLHAALLALLVAALVFSLYRALRGFAPPSRQEGLRRLEQDSGLKHRPLSAWDEIPLAGGAESQSLWQAHRRRLAEQVKTLRLKLPKGGLERVDPIALRAALGLLLVVALVGAGPEWRGNLARALQPNLQGEPPPQAKLDLWITPPGYTALPPLVLATATEPPVGAEEALATEAPEGSQAEPPLLKVPAGSEVLAQIQGGRGEPLVALEGAELAPFEPIAGEALRAIAELSGSGLLEVSQGGKSLGAWRIEALPDAQPLVEFASAPARNERAALRIDYLAEDDYGVTLVSAEISLLDRPEEQPLVIELLRPAGSLQTVEQSAFHDFTPHPWAGLPVAITLTAEDAAGQQGRSDTIETVLPERIFQHPVARALVELRKRLTQDPTRRFPVARALAEIGERPEHFFGDTVVVLALQIAQRRLLFNDDLAAVQQVQDILWKTALRIEEGELNLSQRDLMDLMDQLQRALEEGAPDEVIEELMDRLQQAMDRYLDEMTRQALQGMNENSLQQNIDPQDMQSFNRQDLQDLLDAAREMSEAGSRETAQDLLSQLQQMLQNLQTAQSQGQQGEQSRGMEMMNELNSMLQQQRDLLDRSFRRSQDGENGNQDGQEGGDQRPGQRPGDQPGGQFPNGNNQMDADQQAQLRQQLNRMMQELGQMMPGDLPPSLGEAERQMGNAESQLRGDNPRGASDSQRRALSELQQGAQSLVERMMEQMGQGEGGQAGSFGEDAGTTRDPFGRNPAGRGMGEMGGVEVPELSDVERAQELMRELQRRSGERQRPRGELDYIDRLLNPF